MYAVLYSRKLANQPVGLLAETR